MLTVKSYPYPVLGNGDDIDGIFNPSFQVALSPENVLLEYNIDIQNNTIETLISQGIAVFVIQIECNSTFFRRSYKFVNQRGEISIPAVKLREKVKVSFFVCTQQDIPKYMPSNCHSDYDGLTFSLEKGDILADGGEGVFIAEKSFDPLSAPISSFMKVQPGNFVSGPMQVDPENDDIIIRLSKEDYNSFLKLRDINVSSLHSSVVLPALLDILHLMNKNNDESIESYSWFMRLKEICRARRIDLDNELEAAQKLLSNPLERSFLELIRFSDED